MSRDGSLFVPALVLTGVCATGAHVMHGFNESSHQKQLEAITTALSSGSLRVDLIVDGNSPISLNKPSDSDLARIGEIAVKGRRNIGDNEFPEYKKSTLVLKTASGEEACRVRLESRTLSDLVNAAKAAPSATKPLTLDDLARACGKSAEELQKTIKVTFNDKVFQQEFGSYVETATPHPIVSNGQTVSTVIPQSSRMV